ncbi:Rieske (2Fe-2S) protein [Nonomuraea wenchangensis]|uniref:Rieske (2Fe-2S) protein n=1 Tax=Nonomuraea wenchangensis TaxID=568860 RepID=UPI003437F56D
MPGDGRPEDTTLRERSGVAGRAVGDMAGREDGGVAGREDGGAGRGSARESVRESVRGSTQGSGGVPGRREVLGVAGVAVCGVALAACGTGDAKSRPSLKGQVIAKTADVPVGGGKLLGDLKLVVTQPQQGVYKAFSAACTHKGCTVSTPKDNVITCACHGSEFAADSGAPKKGPATAPLTAIEVKVEGDGIVVA